MIQTPVLTAKEAGLSRNEQIRIALERMRKNGGRATIQEIYRTMEEEMGNAILSEQGRASLRTFINRDAVAQRWVVAVNGVESGWEITATGLRYLDELKEIEGVEEEETLSLDVIHEPYDPTQIKIDLKPFPIFQVMKKIKDKEIDLQPDFQRHVVWDDVRQSRLIESILIRIPLPAFYLDARDEDKWLIVDGLQRLYTLDRFYNKNTLALKNLEFLKELDGKPFSQLPRKFQRQIEDTALNLYIIQPDTPANVKFTIFYRINTGGLVLTAQEIRHALFPGTARSLLKELSESPEFLEATTGSISPKRMDDRECVLRFLAFKITPYTKYQSDLDGFLSDAMQYINKLSAREVDELKQSFRDTMNRARVVFGEYAFRKMDKQHGRRLPISKALFETWSIMLLEYSESVLVRNKERIIAEFIEVINNDSKFLLSISQGTGSVANVRKRFSTIQEILQRAVK